jgi:hypothetical protein
MNNEHRTLNIEQRTLALATAVRRSAFRVPCLMFSFFAVLFATPHVLGQPDTNGLPPLIPAYAELPPTFWEQHQAQIIVTGFAVLAVASLFLKTMLRPKAMVALPPEAVARRALAGLQGRPEDGKQLSEVSQILRRYVIATFQLPAAELTTAEFCAAIGDNEKFGAELAQAVSTFLRECDERKFSMTNSAAPLNAAVRALDLVNLAEQHRALRSAPGPGAATPKTPAAPGKPPATQPSDGRTP